MNVDDEFTAIDVGILVLDAVAVLHEKGYELVRVLPGMSPSGTQWRVNVTTADNMTDDGYLDLRNWDTTFGYTTGSGLEVAGTRASAATTPSDLAALIQRALPDGAGGGRDPEYVIWYSRLLEAVHSHHALPIAYDDDFDPQSGWKIRGNHPTRISQPPQVAKSQKQIEDVASSTPATRGHLLDIARQMQSDPLARIMHGSRELFHSNLLAWLIELFPDEMGRALNRLVPPESGPATMPEIVPPVRREWMNLDLVVNWDNAESMVIENKIFSLPTTEQLDRYAKKIAAAQKSSGTRAVLLSLSDPRWEQNCYRSGRGDAEVVWRYASYGELADSMEREFGVEAASNSTYELQTAVRYVHLIKRLHRIAKLVDVSDPDNEPVFIGHWLDDLGDSQFRSVISKLRAYSVIRYVNDRVSVSGLRRNIDAGMTNATPMIEMSYPQGNLKRSHHYGWQLQGAQLRLTAVLPDLAGRSEPARIRRVDWGMHHERLFDFTGIAEIVGVGDLKVTPVNSFNRYDPAFIYRYVSVPELTVAQLVRIADERQQQVAAYMQDRER